MTKISCLDLFLGTMTAKRRFVLKALMLLLFVIGAEARTSDLYSIDFPQRPGKENVSLGIRDGTKVWEASALPQPKIKRIRSSFFQLPKARILLHRYRALIEAEERYTNIGVGGTSSVIETTPSQLWSRYQKNQSYLVDSTPKEHFQQVLQDWWLEEEVSNLVSSSSEAQGVAEHLQKKRHELVAELRALWEKEKSRWKQQQNALLHSQSLNISFFSERLLLNHLTQTIDYAVAEGQVMGVADLVDLLSKDPFFSQLRMFYAQMLLNDSIMLSQDYACEQLRPIYRPLSEKRSQKNQDQTYFFETLPEDLALSTQGGVVIYTGTLSHETLVIFQPKGCLEIFESVEPLFDDLGLYVEPGDPVGVITENFPYQSFFWWSMYEMDNLLQ